jgi:heptaprenyl diphosphate synthase
VPTLPVLLLRRGNRPEDRELLAALAGDLAEDAALAEVVDALRAHPVMAEAREVTASWAADARSTLSSLPSTDVRSALDSLCNFVVNRSA